MALYRLLGAGLVAAKVGTHPVGALSVSDEHAHPALTSGRTGQRGRRPAHARRLTEPGKVRIRDCEREREQRRDKAGEERRRSAGPRQTTERTSAQEPIDNEGDRAATAGATRSEPNGRACDPTATCDGAYGDGGGTDDPLELVPPFRLPPLVAPLEHTSHIEAEPARRTQELCYNL